MAWTRFSRHDKRLRRERPKPLLELAQQFDARKGFDPASARYIAIGYFDFLHSAGVTACQLADGDAKARADKMRAQARQRLRIWEEIEDMCTSPAECMTKRYAAVHQVVANADPRDVENAGSRAALINVNLVQPEQGVRAWLASLAGITRWSTSKADWLSYEEELGKLRHIERSLHWATSLRQTVASALLTESETALIGAELSLVKAKAQLSNSSIASNNKAKADAAAALPQRTVVADLKQAETHDGRLKAAVEAARKRLKAVEDLAVEISTSADNYNKTIAAAAAEAERRRVAAEILRAELREMRSRAAR